MNSYVRRNSFLDMCFLFLFWYCIIGPQKNHSLFRWQSKFQIFKLQIFLIHFLLKPVILIYFSAFTPEAVDVSWLVKGWEVSIRPCTFVIETDKWLFVKTLEVEYCDRCSTNFITEVVPLFFVSKMLFHCILWITIKFFCSVHGQFCSSSGG